ncbi:MAG TPA: acyl-CoA dehydrogenase family protein [Acidimicrobiia bacterium]|nr:acyl-CoA dehydrogenase family protein [Acidimicrobiia bacterium]
MNFSLSDDQQLLRDTARTMLAKECPTTLLRAHIDDPAAADPLWERLRDFAALAGGPCADLCLFLEELGYVAAPGVFFPTVALAGPVLAAAGDERLQSVVEGTTSATLALAGADGTWRTNTEPVKTFVAEADRVDWIVVVDGGSGSQAEVRVLAPGDADLRRVGTIDFSRRMFEVGAHSADATPVDAAAIDAALVRATVAAAAELVGTARRSFDMSLAYAKERIQFDVPIGSFQAIQHRLAECSLGVERAVAAVQYAALAVDADDADQVRAAHVAKAAAGSAATRAAKDAQQVHGGIGYTWEHDLHLFTRHTYGSEHWLGTTTWHHDRLAELLFD